MCDEQPDGRRYRCSSRFRDRKSYADEEKKEK
jgi:hypothetical protein